MPLKLVPFFVFLHLYSVAVSSNRVPWRKHNTFTGTFDPEKMLVHKLSILRDATQSSIQDASYEQIPFVPDPDRSSSEPLRNIQIGTPPQEFVVLLDTSQTGLWVASVLEPDEDNGSVHKRKYNHSLSSTCSQVSNDTHLDYDVDGSINDGGLVFTDIVSMGGLTANLSFVAAANMTDFNVCPIDGIMGLARPNHDQQNFVVSTWSQNITSEPVFSMKIASSGSELFIGGSNPELYTGEFEYHKVTETLLAC